MYEKAPGDIQMQGEADIACSLNANVSDRLWWNMALLFQLKVCICASRIAFIMDKVLKAERKGRE